MSIPIFPGDSSAQFNFFPPELSDGAKDAVLTYVHQAERYADSDILPRTSRVIGSLALFAYENLPPHAFDAAALMPLSEQIQHPNRPRRYQAASNALHEYFNRDNMPLSRSNGYVGTLLGDLPHLEVSAGSYKNRLNERELGLLEGHEPIPQEEWINFTVGANIPEIARVHDVTNVESQLIKAADAADRIIHAPDDDQELLDRIIRAESSHSVPLEVYGFHAFDMMLRSTAGKMRVLKAGHEQILEQATDTLGRAKNISTEDILYQFFGTRPQEHLFQTAKESLYDETIIYSSTPLSELMSSVDDGEVHARFKTVGKYALKLLRNPHYSREQSRCPSDLFGMLAVLPDERQLAAFFTDTIRHVVKNDAVDLKVAASKKKPLYIQGSPEYVQTVCKQLPNDILQNIEIEIIQNKPADHIYQVIKFTSVAHIGGEDIPVEFQFQTATDRDNARLGKPSHMNHNAKSSHGVADVILGTPDDLRTIYNRKHDIDPRGQFVNTRSIVHGEEMRQLYERSRRMRP